MIKKIKYLCAILLFIAFNLYTCLHFFHLMMEFKLKNDPISIEVLKPSPPQVTWTVDIDKDEEDEVVFSCAYGIPDKQEISIFEPFQRDYNFHYYGEILVPISHVFFDAYYHEKLKTYVFKFLEHANEGFILKELDNRQYIQKELPFETLREKLDPYAYETGHFRPILVDLESGGKDEMVVIFGAKGKKSTRGAACFDPQTGKKLWEYYSGTGIVTAEFKDLDKDEKKEIILSTFAYNDGITMNGASDAYSYVIVLDSNGKELWKKGTGNWDSYSYNIVSDLDNDGVFEIVTVTECRQARIREREKIFIFDGCTGEQKKAVQEPDVSFSKPFIRESKTGTRIYVGDSHGDLRMYDRELNLIKKIAIKEKTPVYTLTAPTPADKWNYVFVYVQDQLMAYDMELKRKVFNLNFESPPGASEFIRVPLLVPLNTKQGNHMLVNSDKFYVLSESKQPFSRTIKNMINSGLPLIIMAFLLFNLLVVYFLYRLKKTSGIRNYQAKKTVKVSQTLEVFQVIAHQVKNPLSTIMWTAEKIKRSTARSETNEEKPKPENYGQLADFLLDDVKTLKQHTNNILKLIQMQKPDFRETRLKPLLQKQVEHYRTLLDEHIDLQLEMEEDVIVSIDNELFKEALVNLIDNGIAAMPDGGKLTISAVPVVSPTRGHFSYVLIEIEDTGIGMDEEELSRVFTPFFTQKEKGTGIGLTICKRIIEAHNGTIDIQSRKNFGTKIAIKIPVQ
jgi:signal transduction histidine kinase